MNSAYAKIVAADVAAGRLKSWKLSIAKNLEANAPVMLQSLANYRALSDRTGANLQGMNSKIADKSERENTRKRLYALVEQELGLSQPAAAEAAAKKTPAAAEAAKKKATPAEAAAEKKAAAAAKKKAAAAAAAAKKKAAAAEAAAKKKAAAAAKKAAAAEAAAKKNKQPQPRQPAVARVPTADYELSPLPGQVCPSTAHGIKCRGSVVNNIRMVKLGEIRDRPDDEKVARPQDYIARLFPTAQYLDSGAFGNVFKVAGGDPAGIRALMGEMAHVLTGARPPPGGFVIKVARYSRKYGTWAEFIASNVHEASVHSYLSKKSTCAPVSCSGGKVCSADVVPEFHVAGSVRAAGLFVTIMEGVNGMLLKRRFPSGSTMSPRHYALIEKAVATLWMVGVSHSDFHRGNAMIVNDNRVVIIDFGMAVVLPAPLRQRIVRDLGNMPALSSSLANTVWYAKNTIQNYTDKVQDKRTDWYPEHHLRYYNPEGKTLRNLWNMVPAAERVKIPGLRAKLWGCARAGGN
jgi:hypothetical protein